MDSLRAVLGQLLEEQEARLLKAIKGLLDASLSLSLAAPQDVPRERAHDRPPGSADRPAAGRRSHAAALPERQATNAASVFQILRRPAGLASPVSKAKPPSAARHGGVKSFENARARELLLSGLSESRFNSDPPLGSKTLGDVARNPTPPATRLNFNIQGSMSSPSLKFPPVLLDAEPPAPSSVDDPSRAGPPPDAAAPEAPAAAEAGGPDGGRAARAAEAPRTLPPGGARTPGRRASGGEFSDLTGAVPAPPAAGRWAPAGGGRGGRPAAGGHGRAGAAPLWPRGLLPLPVSPYDEGRCGSSSGSEGAHEALAEAGRGGDGGEGSRSSSHSAGSSQDSLQPMDRSETVMVMRLVNDEVVPTPSNDFPFREEQEGAAGLRTEVLIGSEDLDLAAGAPLGVDVQEGRGGLLILSIQSGGLIAAWNGRNPERELRAGDWIAEVNGQSENMLWLLHDLVGRRAPMGLVAVRTGAARGEGGGAPAGSLGASEGRAPTVEVGEEELASAVASGAPKGYLLLEELASSLTGRRGSRARRVQPDAGAAAEAGTPTVQKLRQRREDGLVEAVVQKQTAPDPASCSSPASAEPDPEMGVGAPLWLRICGTLPWQRGGRSPVRCGLQAAYSLLVLALLALAVGFFASAPGCGSEACRSRGGLALASGSLLGLLALRRLEQSHVLGSPEALLVAYAQRQQIVEPWARGMRSSTVQLGLLWACSAGLRGASLWRRGPAALSEAPSAGALAAVSFVFLGVVDGILHASCALSMMIDSFVAHFDGRFELERSVYEWNLLQAVLRKVSGAAERGFMAVQSTAVALVTGVMLAARGPLRGEAVGEAVGAGDAAWLSSAALLVVGAAFIFFKTAEVSERCMRMPSVINSLNFGECVDARRHYLVEFIKYSAAGFYVWEVRLTAAVALKLTYFCCILAFAGLSQLYAQDL